jgi:ferrous-iron efflux pump FieF
MINLSGRESRVLKQFFSKSQSSYQTKQNAILMSLVFGIFGLIPGLVVVIMANSLTVFTDLLRNLGLVFATLFSFITIRKVAKGKTQEYNYGYGKMENLSSMVVAGVMLIAITTIVFQTIGRFQNPVPLKETGTWVGIATSALAAAFNGWLWWQSYRAARKEPSAVMESVWRLNQIKMVSTLCVMTSLVLSFMLRHNSWAIYIDPCGSVVLLGFLVFSTYNVIFSSVYDLLDRTLGDTMQIAVLRELARHFDSYEAIHGVRSRRAGGNIYIELFLEFDRGKQMGEVQGVIDQMKTDIEKKIPGSQVTIMPSTQKVI